MAMVDIYPQPIADHASFASNTTSTTFALDATGETTGDGIASAFVPLPDDEISEIYALVTAVTGTPPTYRMKIETMSASRTPSNTIATAGCYVDVTPGAAGWVGGAVGTNHATGSSPSPLFVTARYNAGTCDGSNFATFARYHPWLAGATSRNHPYTLTMTAGTWGGAASGLSNLVVKYASGAIQDLHFHGSTTAPVANNSSWGTGTAPLYRGNGWTPPVAYRVCGVTIAMVRLPDTNNFKVRVLDNVGNTICVTADLDPDQLIQSSASILSINIPLDKFTHPANTTYYYVVEPTAAVNPTVWCHMLFNSREAIRAIGGNLFGATLTSAFSIVNYDNGSDGYRLYPVYPVVDQVDSDNSVFCSYPVIIRGGSTAIGY